jgi:hypothetical protein
MAKIGTSVVDGLKKAHAALMEDLHKLEQVVQPTSSATLSEVRARLGATRTHITEHFRFEEENGYMDTVRTREPRLEREVQWLAEEHRELARSLEALVGDAAAAQRLEDRLRHGVTEWIKRVRQHESRENDLFQDAFNLDIGPED